MAEWSNAAVLKTVEVQASGGSNPSFSATSIILNKYCWPPERNNSGGQNAVARSKAKHIAASENERCAGDNEQFEFGKHAYSSFE